MTNKFQTSKVIIKPLILKSESSRFTSRCLQINRSMSTDSYSGLSMLTVLVGVLCLANMAQSGRSSYEEILIKAKNDELSTPDDPSVKSAGEYSFIYKCYKWVPECCFPKFSIRLIFGLFLSCYEHFKLLISHKKPQMSYYLG